MPRHRQDQIQIICACFSYDKGLCFIHNAPTIPDMRISAIIIVSLLLSAPAMAQQKTLTSGMQHIIVTKPKAPEAPNVQGIKPASGGQKDRPAKSQEIWDQYKALAAGVLAKPVTDATKTAASNAPAAQSQTQAAANPTGIAAIIADYRKNKESQREMKTLNFITPTQNQTSPTSQ